MKNAIKEKQVGPLIPIGETAYFSLGEHVVACSIMEVTPELAAAWLEQEHEDNRDIDAWKKYSGEMSAGGWRPTPEPVVFSVNRKMINGGNRCRAVVDSGCTVLLTVWFGWPEDAFQCFDRGAPRSLAQADKIAGDPMDRTVYRLARTLILADKGATTAPDTVLRNAARCLAPAWEDIKEAVGGVKLSRSGLRVPAITALCVAWFSDPNAVRSFVNELVAATQHTGLPSVAVRNFIRWYENSTSGGAYITKDTLFTTCAALRQYVIKADMQFVRPTAEAYRFWREREEAVQALRSATIG